MTISNRTNKTLVFGIGINDADYSVNPQANGSNTACRFYITWKSMIQRCYSKQFHLKNKSYIGCSVSEEWLSFVTFKAWMENQDWRGNCLDKDLLYEGNKIYSKETCVFVPRLINQVIVRNRPEKVKFPQGVSYDQERGKYQAQITMYGKWEYIGRFHTEYEAASAYNRKKLAYILELAESQKDKRIKAALIRHSNKYKPINLEECQA